MSAQIRHGVYDSDGPTRISDELLPVKLQQFAIYLQTQRAGSATFCSL